MTLLNISLPVTTDNVINFQEISPSVNVRFSLPKGNDNRILGRGNKSYTCREQPYVLTDYQIEFPSLKKSEADLIFAQFESLKHQINFFPFNDFSDNFVLNWAKGGVTQEGVIIQILGTDPANPDYQLCKRYTVGGQFSYKPVYFIPDESEVTINDVEYLVGDTNFDRKTGIVSNLGIGLNGAPFETDLYYTLVRISSPISISHYYSEGLNNEGIDPENEPTDEQLFTVSFSMQEVRLNRVLDYDNMLPNSSLPVFEKFDLECFVNGAVRTEERFFNTFEHNGFVANELPNNSKVTPEIQIPSRITKHRELIYYLTIFKACCGCAFNFNP